MEAPSTKGRRYRTLFELARGGMGRVEVAVLEGPRFSRLFALKRLHPHLAEEPAARELFVEEARLAGLIAHPNVVPVVDVGEDAEGPFLVMDLVDGVPASRLITRCHELGSLLPVQVCARIVADVARGLHAAHEAVARDGRPLGLVHRDVSPQNVLIGFDGVARVTDFGVAKVLDSQSSTNTGVLRGKLGYMAPERLRFQPPLRRSDLFSLGVVLVELLTGERLYGGKDDLETARRVLEDPAPDVGQLREDAPAALVELVFSLLAKDPADRPADAGEVAARLDAIVVELAAVEGSLEPARYLTEWFADERAARAARLVEAMAAPAPARPRRRALVAGAATVVAGAAAFGAWRALRAPTYQAGFRWSRAADWHRPGKGRLPPNPAPDAQGQPTWHYEFADGGTAMDGAAPWFLQPSRPMIWDDAYFGAKGVWARSDNVPPAAAQGYFDSLMGNGPARGGVIIRWANPTGRDATIDVTGELVPQWREDADGDVELVLVTVEPAGPHRIVWSRRVPRAEIPPRESVQALGIRVATGGSLLLSGRATGTRAWVTISDRLVYTLTDELRRRP